MKLHWMVGINRVSTAIVFTLIALIVLLVSALDGCSGWRATAEASRRWLPGAMPDLNEAVSLLQTCQPRDAHYGHITPVFSDGGTNSPSCINGASEASIDEIIADLKRHRIRSVNYKLDPIGNRSISSANFVLYQSGMAFTRSELVGIKYFTEAQPCLQTGDQQDVTLYEQQPLTASPCHWFWQHDSE